MDFKKRHTKGRHSILHSGIVESGRTLMSSNLYKAFKLNKIFIC